VFVLFHIKMLYQQFTFVVYFLIFRKQFCTSTFLWLLDCWLYLSIRDCWWCKDTKFGQLNWSDYPLSQRIVRLDGTLDLKYLKYCYEERISIEEKEKCLNQKGLLVDNYTSQSDSSNFSILFPTVWLNPKECNKDTNFWCLLGKMELC
jgi:hypothetical protein